MTTAFSVSDQTTRPWLTGVMRKLLSFPVAIASLLAVLGVLTVRSRFDDPDMWWHLKTGQIIWTTRTIPTTDVFSYTTNHHAWVPHEWLSQVLIYGAYRFGGYSGLMLWLCFFTAAILIAGYILCCLYSGNAKVSFLGAMTIWFFATAGLAIRPQMIGYLLLIVELLLIHMGRTRNPRWFLGLPLSVRRMGQLSRIFFLWISVGSRYFSPAPSSISGWVPSSPRIGTRALASCWASRCWFRSPRCSSTPSASTQVLYPLNTWLHQPVGVSVVDEWMPLTMNAGRGLGFLIVLGCVLLIVLIRRSELSLDEVGMLALGTWLAVGHRRMLFVFGILAGPILSRLLAPLWDGYDANQDRPLPNAILIAASLLILALGFPNRQNLGQQVEDGSPVKAVEYIQTHHLSGPMLNEYVYGGYLIWAAPDLSGLHRWSRRCLRMDGRVCTI